MNTRLLLAVLFAGAFALRVFGLQYGLPSVYNPDEVAIMARALSFAKGALNPHNFLYPTFYFYVLFGWVGTYFAFVWLTGGVSSTAALQQLYFTDPTGIYTAGRLLGATLGTLCVPAIYRLGRLGTLYRRPRRVSRQRPSSRSRPSPFETRTTSNTTLPRRSR